MRVSVQQLQFLARCMEEFPLLAVSNFKRREDLDNAHKKWLQIGSALNKIKPGIIKEGLAWARYWARYKYQLRQKKVKLSPLTAHFYKVLAIHEKNQPPHAVVNFPTTKEKPDKRQKDPSINNAEQEILDSKLSKQKTSGQKRKISPMPEEQEVSELMQSLEDGSFSNRRTGESPSEGYGDHDDDENFEEDPIALKTETLEEIQNEILKFKLKRQKEMHELQMKQMKEKHTVELEMLKLKRIKFMRDCDNIRNELMLT